MVAAGRACPGIKAGLIAVRCLDPKGGMEFAAGAPLFDRFAHDSDSILAVLHDTTATMLDRAQRLAGPPAVIGPAGPNLTSCCWSMSWPP